MTLLSSGRPNAAPTTPYGNPNRTDFLSVRLITDSGVRYVLNIVR